MRTVQLSRVFGVKTP